jgi:hypothetical protein
VGGTLREVGGARAKRKTNGHTSAAHQLDIPNTGKKKDRDCHTQEKIRKGFFNHGE